ncbi:MAG: ABC transporter permease [Vicinamibacteria bacterium]
MKFLPLLFANLFRKKIRTALTVGSFAVALFLFGLLVAIRGAFTAGVELAGADRLIVMHRASFIQPLPFSHKDKLARIQGVRDVASMSWFGGIYRDPKNFFPQFSIETASWKSVYPEFHVPDADWEAFLADRAGCVVGAATAERFGWKVGDRIPLQGTIFPGAWEFNVRGIYKGTRPQDDTTQLWLHKEYLDEKGPSYWKGIVGWYVVRIADPSTAAAMAKTIDATFANSAWETRTQTEQAFAGAFVQQMGNIELLILVVGGVVFFTLLLVAGNTMAIAVRERTAELAVLKAVGFSDGFTLLVVLAESLLVACVGGGLGILLAKAFTTGRDPTGGFLPAFYIAPGGVVLGFALAAAVGLAAGAIPALSAMRLRVVDGLRRV